jgi:glycogen(starch) synthase
MPDLAAEIGRAPDASAAVATVDTVDTVDIMLRPATAARARPARVLMTADTVGGVFTYAVELCRGLEAHGVHVVLATMGARLTRAQRATVSGLAHVELCESDYRLEWMTEPWQGVDAAGDWLMELEALRAPDVVHLNGYVHGALPWRAPVLVVAHSCVLSWWKAVKREDAPPEWSTYRQRVAAGLHRADLVVAPSRAMLDAVGRLYGRPARTRVIYNGSAPRTLRDGRAPKALGVGPAPHALRVAPKEPLVLSAGRLWDEAKNLAALHACHALLPWPVYVAGPMHPPDSGPVGDPARASWEGLHVLGTLTPEDMAAWMARAAIYALPARYEPFGLSVLEAALSGCALALGDIDSLREVWGDTAVFVPPDDAEGLAHAISGLARDRGRRTRLAGRSTKRALRYTAERMTREYLDAYGELMRARHFESCTPDNFGSLVNNVVSV